MEEKPFLGLRTVIYAAPDLSATKAWYAKALAIEPYFDEPFYVGFNVGGYELGLIPDATIVEGSTISYWGVADINKVMQRFLNLGATLHTDIQDVGDGIKTASIKDPFGNVVGLIENPHFSL
ncbi:VOC family protein [Spirosoma endbachense]|uniref:VOC family protein n=1 Tax=Spirosoma endbachense TaxID=2666025 RepID=A0A6P1VMZ1_9BACT|nr:VOC family protein [Spirosoma endbachense]QHV93808.1 VOC family protein [Spirosoma endbachense]